MRFFQGKTTPNYPQKLYQVWSPPKRVPFSDPCYLQAIAPPSKCYTSQRTAWVISGQCLVRYALSSHFASSREAWLCLHGPCFRRSFGSGKVGKCWDQKHGPKQSDTSSVSILIRRHQNWKYLLKITHKKLWVLAQFFVCLVNLTNFNFGLESFIKNKTTAVSAQAQCVPAQAAPAFVLLCTNSHRTKHAHNWTKHHQADLELLNCLPHCLNHPKSRRIHLPESQQRPQKGWLESVPHPWADLELPNCHRPILHLPR